MKGTIKQIFEILPERFSSKVIRKMHDEFVLLDGFEVHQILGKPELVDYSTKIIIVKEILKALRLWISEQAIDYKSDEEIRLAKALDIFNEII